MLRIGSYMRSGCRVYSMKELSRNNQHWYTRRYGTGSGIDRAPAESALSRAPGRYRSRYRTNVACFDLGSAGRRRRFKHFLRITLLALSLAASVKAQEAHQHQHELGKVNFTISCSVSAQKQFNRAVAWLHSFEYEEAEKAFTQISLTDQKCAMGYWGVAMSNYHPIWAPPTAEELKKGQASIEKAKSVGAGAQRERDYIAAIEVFYKDAGALDHRTRAFAYRDAMERLYRRYPKDREAAVFYALTLIATGMMANDKSYAGEK